MNSYNILKSIHKIGHPMSGIVLGYEIIQFENLPTTGNIYLKTKSKYKSVLPFDYFFDYKPFNENLLPEKGTRINTVIKNHVDDTLYLSARPVDLDKATRKAYREYYTFITKIPEGTIVNGIVSGVAPFGVFVDLSSPFCGLVDIGDTGFNGVKLPYNQANWPQKGESIKCIVSYFRFYNMEIGLKWIPEEK